MDTIDIRTPSQGSGTLCISSCDLLALSTLVSQSFIDMDADNLRFWANFLVSVGTNLIMIADQRDRRTQAKRLECVQQSDKLST